MSAYNGFLYGPSGQQIYPTPRESPGKHRPRPLISREVKRSISQYDHAELVSISTSICCRIPALRGAIRDKNSWAFANWLPIFLGDDEKWGEEAEEYLIDEVLPNAAFRELRRDYAWLMRVSGMGLDIHGDDLAVFTEDEQHNPKIDIIPGPRIGSGTNGYQYVTTVLSGSMTGIRPDGQGLITEGRFAGCGIYNGVIRRNGIPVACRVLGYDSNGNPTFTDIDLGSSAHYACEMEFLGQGRGLPRPAASILHWMKKEEIDDQFLKGLANAAQRAVIHKLPPGKDASMALGNAIQETTVSVPLSDGTTEERTVFVEYTQDGNVAYIGADEELGGIDFENPHPNAEAFAVRVMVECLGDLGWSYKLLASDGTSGAPTRLETQKANNSICERQSGQESRSIRFFQYAISKGMENGRISRNRNGTDPFKWGIGFPASLTVDSGNDVTASLNRLKMGLTNERIEASKDGHVAKHILRQREKELQAKLLAADRACKFAASLGRGEEFPFEKAMEFFYQPNPNSSVQAAPEKPESEPPKVATK